ncbi:MAG: hypothetical protein LBE27_04925 [Deltaproteobacteria bacterium]|nr:hypothetical protein [Deltaproteobacteria bacterium]
MLDSLLTSGSGFVREVAPLLEKKSLSVFRNNESSNDNILNETHAQNVDDRYVALGDIQIIKSADDPYLLLTGAVIDPSGAKKIDSVYVKINEEPYLSFFGIKDPLVLRLSKRKRFRYNGFVRAVPLRLLKPGRNQLSILFTVKDNTYIFEPNIQINLDSDTISIKKSVKL